MGRYTYESNIEYAPFNSINRDRAINANHLARWLSSTNSNGVTRKFDEFNLTITNGLNVVLGRGIGLVEGHHIYSKFTTAIELEAANVSNDRIDTIGFVLEIATRKVVLYYKTGEVGSGTPPEVLNNDAYVEVPLYNITVPRGATTLVQSNIQDVREYVVSSATFFKKYNQVINVVSRITQATITTPFNQNTDDIDIYVNGIVLLKNQYSINGRYITFNSAINSGSEIQINVWHFQDGSGQMDTFSDVLGQIQNIREIEKYYYFCTGQNDNIALSNIAQNFLNGVGEFAGINENAQIEIIVCGDMGVINSRYEGDGSTASPNVYFKLGRATTHTRTIYFNFSNCSRLLIAPSSLSNVNSVVFSGADINIRNVAVNVLQGYNVDMFNGTNIHCEDSEFWMTTTNDCCVGKCCGYFTKVRTSITSTNGNAYGFYGNGRLLRVIGGDHYAWTGNAGGGKEAVCFYVAAYQTENVIHVTMANMPEQTRSGYTQSRPIKINSGYATFTQNTMWMVATNANGSFYSADASKCYASGNSIISKN